MDFNTFRQEGKDFGEDVLKILSSIGIEMKEPITFMDHLCYRVSSEEEYHSIYSLLETNSSILLVEDLIGGRMIATFKLKDPIAVGGFLVPLIELPMPKAGSPYARGFEHCELVVGLKTNLMEFSKRYPNLIWDFSGLKKDRNSDIRIELTTSKEEEGSRKSVKFHHETLEKVIVEELEEKRKATSQGERK